MPNGSSSHRLLRALAVVRGLMLILFMVALLVIPEKVMPGSSGEPARRLALFFISRTILLGASFIVLAIRGRITGLGWVFLADATLQVFDTGLTLAMRQGALAILPALIGALEFWAGLVLVRSGRIGSV